ncbi:MAG: TonB-dependent receptor [Filimonas sp.]|nr:TonB-dependent receptor [Filimonas sp.]
MNCYRLMLFVPLLLTALTGHTQTTSRMVRGTVRDSAGQALPGASIRLITSHDTTGVTTHDDGSFEIPHVKEPRFNITVFMMSYLGFKHDYSLNPQDTVGNLGVITLRSSTQQLKTVTVHGTPPALVFHGDTVEYSPANYQVRDGSSIGEVVRQLPGLETDHTGKVTAQGKDIAKVRLNGKVFYVNDVTKALKNLPANVIEKVQVIDDYGEQANLTGIRTGEPQKVLNLTVKEDKSSGVFGTATVGAGTDNMHLGSVNVNRFKQDRQLSLSGDWNNTNAGAFSFGDNGGISSADGTNTSKGMALNYRDKFSANLSGDGGFNLSKNKSLLSGIIAQQTIDGNYVNLNNQQAVTTATTHTYNVYYNLEYHPDSLSLIRILPSINRTISINAVNSQFHIAQQNLHPVKISDGNNDNNTTSDNNALNAFLMYNRRFLKKDRNLNITFAINDSRNTIAQDTRTSTHLTYVDSLQTDTSLHQQTQNPSHTRNINTSLSYVEPVGRTSVLELNYNLNISSNDAHRETWNIDPADVKTRVDSQSNQYDYQFVVQRLAFNYNLRKKQHNLVLGVVALPRKLAGNSTQPDFSTHRKEFNVAPNLRYQYNISNKQSFSVTYSANPGQPNFQQLMPITDLTNPQYPVVGNPKLKTEFSHNVNVGYRTFDPKRGSSFFVGFYGSLTNNRVFTNIVNDSAHLAHMSGTVIQETRYVNANGAMNSNMYYSFTQPLLQKKLSIRYSGNFNYSNDISYVNDVRQLGRNLGYNQSLRVRLNLINVIDVDGGGSYNRNSIRYNTPGGYNSAISSWNFDIYGRNYIGKHLIIGWNASKALNSGYSSGVAANPTVVNAYVECQFLKSNLAALRFQGFDLLNENVGVSHSVNGPVITDTRNERLSRYLMLSFSYRLQKFGF